MDLMWVCLPLPCNTYRALVIIRLFRDRGKPPAPLKFIFAGNPQTQARGVRDEATCRRRGVLLLRRLFLSYHISRRIVSCRSFLVRWLCNTGSEYDSSFAARPTAKRAPLSNRLQDDWPGCLCMVS